MIFISEVWSEHKNGPVHPLLKPPENCPRIRSNSSAFTRLSIQGKNSTQAVLWAHIALDYRCTSAQYHDRDGFEVESRFHGCREKPFGVKATLPPDNGSSHFVHAAGLSAQHMFHLSIGNRHPDIPANLFLCFVDSSDHAELQTAAGRGIGDAVFQRVLQGVGFMVFNILS